MRVIILICLLGLSFQSLAQTYEHYRYNDAGVPEKAGYTTVRQPQQFGTYQPKFNTNLYREVVEAKQRAYNQNVSDISELIRTCFSRIEKLSLVNEKAAKEWYDAMKGYVEVLDPKADYSDANLSRGIINTITAAIRGINNAISANQ